MVTFSNPESARRACSDPIPMIDGRRANCNIASLGRPRPSPPRGRSQDSNIPFLGNSPQGAQSYRGPATTVPSPSLSPPPPVMYPHYGYPHYAPHNWYRQVVHNPQVQQPQNYQQMYGVSYSVTPPYYYDYSLLPPRGLFSPTHQAQRAPGPSYVYYPGSAKGSLTTVFAPQPRQPSPSTDSQTTPQTTSEMEGGTAVTSESPNS